MKSKIYSLLLLASLFFILEKINAQNEKTGKAILKGKLVHFGSSVRIEDFSDIQHMVPASYNQTINLSADSLIQITVPLNKPCYFRIGRNKLYLSPGDNLEFVIDDNTSLNASYKGKGCVANEYLKNVAFPKAGSYLEAGKYIKTDAKEMLEFILDKAKEKEKQLLALTSVSPEFIRLERARNRADIVKSILAVNNYSIQKFKDQPKEARDKYVAEFQKMANPIKDSLLKNFVDPSYLQIEVYRDISDYLDFNNADPIKKSVFDDWLTAYKLAWVKIKPQNDKSKIPLFIPSIDSIKTKRYKEILHLLVAEKMKFGIGDNAIDFTVINSDLKNTTLSSLKGKVIYIDIWATWCGPCMGEMPFLDAFKEKYKSANNLAIVSLSIDDNNEVWLNSLEQRKPGGIQWRIDRPKLSKYEIESIPRFILIDKDFKIADMDALYPSDRKLPAIIDALLSSFTI